MRQLLLRTALITLLATPAFAASTSLKGLPAGSYALDKSHAFIVFSINHLGFSTYYGRVNDFDGTLSFDPAFVEKSKLTLDIDPASIDTNNKVLEDELDSDKFFDVKKYPTATFVTTDVHQLTPTRGRITGDFTLHGVTKPVTLDVTFNGQGPMPMGEATTVLGFSAKGKIKRSDFGINYGLPHVGDDVDLQISAEFHLKK